MRFEANFKLLPYLADFRTYIKFMILLGIEQQNRITGYLP